MNYTDSATRHKIEWRSCHVSFREKDCQRKPHLSKVSNFICVLILMKLTDDWVLKDAHGPQLDEADHVRERRSSLEGLDTEAKSSGCGAVTKYRMNM